MIAPAVTKTNSRSETTIRMPSLVRGRRYGAASPLGVASRAVLVELAGSSPARIVLARDRVEATLRAAGGQAERSGHRKAWRRRAPRCPGRGRAARTGVRRALS